MRSNKDTDMPRTMRLHRVAARVASHHVVHRHGDAFGVLLTSFLLLLLTALTTSVTIRPANASFDPRTGLTSANYSLEQNPTFFVDTNGLAKLDNRKISAKLLSEDGKTIGVQSAVSLRPGSDDEFIVSLAPEDRPTPGKYEMQVVIKEGDKSHTVTQDFTWGVLALNLDRSSYRMGEIASFGMAVLDDRGVTLCDSDVSLDVIRENRKIVTLSTEQKTIKVSDTCADKNVTNNPDYIASYIPKEEGEYTLHLSASTKNGSREMWVSFVVTNDAAFVSERVDTAMRLYPAASYGVVAKLRAERVFHGQFEERVPHSFSITDPTLELKKANGSRSVITNESLRIDIEGSDRLLRWGDISLEPGDELVLKYTYKPPYISPAFYQLGPLKLSDGKGAVTYKEPRAWQLASDAAGDVIVLWDTANGAVPAGWTCISCISGDAFYQLFPRANSTYAGTGGGPESVTHTYAQTNVTGPSAVASNTNTSLGSRAVGSATHNNHVFPAPTISSVDIKPPYKNLKFIKASNPLSLPANAIAMFDVASTASLPTNWTSYAALNDPGSTGLPGNGVYLRGENTNTTGGTATHSHTRSAVTSGTATTVNIATGTAKTISNGNHTHQVAAGNTTTENNDPSYISVVFAQVSTANEAIPNGMLAFFDNTTLPTGWTQQTAISGNALANRLIKGSLTAGTTGGRTTHDHGASQVITSTGPSTTNTGPNSGITNTTPATSTHTHNVTFSITAGSSMPNYRDVIVGKFATVNVTGTVYSDEGSTTLGSVAVKGAINGSAYRATTAAANGTYTLAMPDPGPGGVFTVWLNTNGGAMGTTVTRSNGGAISGVDIYQNRLVVGHEDSGPTSSVNLGVCDKTTGTVCADSDMHFDEASNNLTVDNDWRLYIKGGKTFTPGGTVTLSPGGTAASVGGDLKWGSSTSTLNVAANALNVGGDWINTAGGNFTKTSGQTTTMTATASGFTVDSSSKNFERLTFNGASGAWSFTPAATAVNVDGNFTITTGTVTAPSGTLSVGGNWLNSAAFTHNSGTVQFTSTTTGMTINPGASDFANVTFNGSGGVWSALTNTLTTIGNLTMTAGTLDNSSGSANIVVNGHVQGTAGVINLTNNTFTQRVATAKNFGATSGSTAWNFNQLIFSNSSGSSATITTQTGGTGNIVVANSLLVSNTGDTAATTLDAGNRLWRLTNTNHGNPFNLDLAGGALTGNSSTFEYAGDSDSSNVTIENGSYNNLTLGGATVESYVSEGALTASANLLVNANATLSGSQNITIGGNVSGAGTINMSGGIFTQRVAAAQNFGSTSGSNDWVFQLLRFENSDSVDHTITVNGSGSGVIRANGQFTIGNASDSNVTTLDNETNDRVIDANDNFTITSKGSYLASSTTALTLGANYLNSGSLTAGTGEVIFDSSSSGRTINAGGTGSTKQFNRVTFNGSGGGWSIETTDMKTASQLTITDLAVLSLQSGRTLEVGGTYSACSTCFSKTTWTGSTLFLNSGTSYTIGSKTQDAEIYGTLQIGANTDIRTWRSSADTTTVDASGSLYSQHHADVLGALNIYGDYHVTGTDYWSYSKDFDGTVLSGVSQRQAVVRIEQGSGRGVTVDSTKTLEIIGGGGGANQFTDVDRINVGSSYKMINNGSVVVQEAKIANPSFNGGTWPVLNTVLTSHAVTSGTLQVDWYLAAKLVGRDSLNNIDTAGSDITISETSTSPAATVFKRTGGAWGSGATSQTADTGSDGRTIQPNSNDALRIREYEETSGSVTYYRYNLSVAPQTTYATYDYKRDYSKYITSTANTASSEDKVISSAWYRDTIATENSLPAVNGSVTSGSWYAGMEIAMLALWDTDDGSIPTGWSCVSCSGGDPFYQRFLRGAATYGGTGGGPESHGHNLSSPSPGAGSTFSALVGATNVSSGTHTHTWDFGAGDDTTSTDNKPPYKNLQVIRGPLAGPNDWPASIIMPFRTTTVPTGWAAYTPLDARYPRGENTNTTGGATSHIHTSSGLTSGASSGTAAISCVSGCSTAANATHTHTLSATALGSNNNDPLHVNVRFMKHSDTSDPPRTDMLAMFDHTALPVGYNLASDAAPYQNNLLSGATSSMESTGGASTHNHSGSLVVTSSTPVEAGTAAATGGTVSSATSTHTHSVTYTVDGASSMPLYRDVVVAKYVPNLDPASPTSLAQKKTSDVTITSGAWINETSVKFTVSASDPDTTEQQLQLCVEKKDTGTSFTGTEDLCGTAVAETGSGSVTLTVTISSLSPDEYHWQARVKDQDNAYSSWVAFDTSDINTRDFGIDTSAPTTATVYDNTNIEAQPSNTDTDQNANGSLTTLSATWADFNADTSGLLKYEYSIGTTPGGTDIKAWTDNATTRYKRDTSLSLQTNRTYYFNVRATDNAGNVSSVVSSNGQIVTPTLTFDIDVDSVDTETSPPYSIDFGSLTASTVSNSPKRIWVDFDTNGVAGGRVYVAGLNDGLRSTAAGFTIVSSTSNLATAQTGFGAQGASAGQSSGGPFVISSPYDGTSDNVGALNTTFQSIFSTSNPIVSGRGSFVLKVKPSSLTPASNDYSETLIIIAAGTY